MSYIQIMFAWVISQDMIIEFKAKQAQFLRLIKIMLRQIWAS